VVAEVAEASQTLSAIREPFRHPVC